MESENMVQLPSATLIMLKMLWDQISIATPNIMLEDLVEILTLTLPMGMLYNNTMVHYFV